MKPTQILTALCLCLAATVTTGSIYMTVSASTTQEDNPFAVPEVPEETAPAILPETPGSSAADEEAPNDVLRDRGHYIELGDEGNFAGQLVSLDSTQLSDVTVKVIREGAVIGTTQTNEDGAFSFSGLEESTVALLAYGPDCFMLFAVNLRDEEAGDNNSVVGLSSAVVSRLDTGVARNLVFENLQETEWRFQGEATNEDQSYPVGDPMVPSTSTQYHDVQLSDDGTLVGEINLLDPRIGHHRGIMDLTVHFIRDGAEIGQTPVNPDGSFQMEGLTPGVHSIVTTGRDGVLALGVNLVQPQLAAVDQGEGQILTSVAQSLDLVVAPVTFRNIQPQFIEGFNPDQPGTVPEGTIVGEVPFATPFGPGGFGPAGGGGGFAGGGGGGLGGGSGLGSLLAGAAGAGLGYALSQDDDGDASANR